MLPVRAEILMPPCSRQRLLQQPHLLLAMASSLLLNAVLVGHLASHSQLCNTGFNLRHVPGVITAPTRTIKSAHLSPADWKPVDDETDTAKRPAEKSLAAIARLAAQQSRQSPTQELAADLPRHLLPSKPSPTTSPSPAPPQPPSVVQPTLAIAVSRHIENIEWLEQLQANLQGHLQQAVLLGLYQTQGDTIYWQPQEGQLAEAEAAAAAAAADEWTPLEVAAGKLNLTHPGLHVLWRFPPINRGNEAMGYLTAIIDNYHTLPDLMVFIHAHRFSTHNHFTTEWLLGQLVRRPPQRLPEGFMPLQCKDEPYDWNMIYPGDLNATHPGFRQEHLPNILESWDALFGHWLGPPPEALLTPANAEFVASREAIRSRPLEFYQAARHWLMVTPLPSFISAMVMEYLWQLILTGEAVRWPTQEECMCSLYAVCPTAGTPGLV